MSIPDWPCAYCGAVGVEHPNSYEASCKPCLLKRQPAPSLVARLVSMAPRIAGELAAHGLVVAAVLGAWWCGPRTLALFALWMGMALVRECAKQAWWMP